MKGRQIILYCLVWIFLFSGCTHKRYYDMDDFESLVVNQSTDMDVLKITEESCMVITARGGYSSFPMEDNKWIVIYFAGPDFVIEKIEVRDTPPN